jgi:HEAT repeat protein
MALVLFRFALASYVRIAGDFMIRHIVEKVDEYISNGVETFEFSDLIWETARITLAEENYELLGVICDMLTKNREQVDGIWNYYSLAVKKGIDELNHREIIDQLVDCLVNGRQSDTKFVRKALVTIGSEEAAVALSTIISHDSRHVRQNVLKILSEMGKYSLNVFMNMLADEDLFAREENRRELPDEKWYIARNSIFVLGSLKDPEACRALRIRITDSDIRVRNEIVQALEKIRGEMAADLLLLLADDPDYKIRESAIITLGIMGSEDMCPELINLIEKYPTNSIDVINSLGKLGGFESRDFLLNLLSDSQNLSKYTSSRVSKENLKLAVLKALGRIGDSESLEKIQEFSDSLSKSSKIFFGGSKLNKAANKILKKNK